MSGFLKFEVKVTQDDGTKIAVAHTEASDLSLRLDPETMLHGVMNILTRALITEYRKKQELA